MRKSISYQSWMILALVCGCVMACFCIGAAWPQTELQHSNRLRLSDVQISYVVGSLLSALPMDEQPSARQKVDSENAAMIWNIVKQRLETDQRSASRAEIANEVIETYPQSLAASEAVQFLVQRNMQSTNTSVSYQIFKSFESRVEVSPKIRTQIFVQLIDTCRREKRYEEGKAYLKELLITDDDDSLRRAWEAAAELYFEIGDIANMEEACRQCNQRRAGVMYPVGNELAPSIALFYMSRQRWDDAIDTWKRWHSTKGGCGSWSVFPEEMKAERIAICYLQKKDYAAAVSTMLFFATERPSNRRAAPELMRIVYKAAEQSADYERIMREVFDDKAYTEWPFSYYNAFGANGNVRELYHLRSFMVEKKDPDILTVAPGSLPRSLAELK